MNFLTLYYFLVVCDEMNITKAAEKLYISQQSLSNHIQKLEKFVGTPLFSRTPSLSLTYAGTRFRIAAKKILDLKNEILTEIDDISNRRRGKLSIGISHTRGKFFLPEVLPTFMEQHPNIEISLTENNSSRLEDALAKGNIDLLIEFSPILLEQVDTVQIFSERLFVVVPKKYITRLFPNSYAEAVHRFKNGFEIEPFAKMPFLLTPIQNRVRNLFQHYVKRHGVSLNVLLESENSETLLSLACKGVGITTYPEMFVNR